MTTTEQRVARRNSRRILRRILARHSKSFALAGRLLPRWCRQDATALYAWCRRCDDAVDTPAAAPERQAAVDRLRAELNDLYSGVAQSDPVLAGMQEVVRAHAIPRRYAEDLLDGMAMDIAAVRYRTVDELLLYCYRAAGTVGLMMAHIMRVDDPAALRRAADLGIAMQLTNVCRDVADDERRGRVYLPEELLGGPLGQPEEADHKWARVGRAVTELLRRADGFYRSGDAGMGALPSRCAVAIRAARMIYAEIGREIERRIARAGFQTLASRAVVSRRRKVWLAVWAAASTGPRRWLARLGSGPSEDVVHPLLPFALPIHGLESKPVPPCPPAPIATSEAWS